MVTVLPWSIGDRVDTFSWLLLDAWCPSWFCLWLWVTLFPQRSTDCNSAHIHSQCTQVQRAELLLFYRGSLIVHTSYAFLWKPSNAWLTPPDPSVACKDISLHFHKHFLCLFRSRDEGYILSPLFLHQVGKTPLHSYLNHYKRHQERFLFS